jgi:hypothetical protein
MKFSEFMLPFLLQTMGLSIGLRVLECGEVGPIGRTRRDSTLSARPKCTVFCIPPLRIPCHHRCLFRNASASHTQLASNLPTLVASRCGSRTTPFARPHPTQQHECHRELPCWLQGACLSSAAGQRARLEEAVCFFVRDSIGNGKSTRNLFQGRSASPTNHGCGEPDPFKIAVPAVPCLAGHRNRPVCNPCCRTTR